ncbi:hypothetical protein F4805DRAFT_459036 [Annulohypoxylon moriforme]|nr:hypothetical protein F4805DRAFT_459036 [Annulohypoxylon moriforme]
MASSKARLRFQADLKSAAEKDYINITNIRKGDAEDEITFVFSHPGLPHPSQVEVHAQPQDVRCYPNDNTFLVYTNDDISPTVGQVLEQSMFESTGMKVDNMLTDLSRRLRAALESGEPNDITMTDADEDTDADASDLDMEDIYSDDGDMPFEYVDDDYGDNNNTAPASTADALGLLSARTLPFLVLDRLRRDLKLVHDAGFHIGIVSRFGDGGSGGIISISIRVNNLCLPKVTREAWGLVPSEYIVLLIQYGGYYNDFDIIINKPVEHARMNFRLRKCPKKKPSNQQVKMAFASRNTNTLVEESDSNELSSLWISKSMEEFMNNEFISILKMRKLHGVSWEKAKEKLHSQIFRTANELNDTTAIYSEGEPNNEAQLPPFIADDHFLNTKELSLPLLAMQFALRYLVRCTDYCTVCHRKVKSNFAALMPYVCSAPLCLHQYINLGFGPSIDHQIINHPEVIDLLISFSYAALCRRSVGIGMRKFPTGLGLRVPRIRSSTFLSSTTGEPNTVNKLAIGANSAAFLVDPISVSFDWGKSLATLNGHENEDVVEEGQWVMLSTTICTRSLTDGSKIVLHHARVESIIDNSLLLNVVSRHSIPSTNHIVVPYPDGTVGHGISKIIPGHLILCNEEFDDIKGDYEKAFSLMILVASIPPVATIREYLMSSRQPLTKWDRMSPASVSLLGWIIASNRSHIVQVDEGSTDGQLTLHPERIGGVNGWIQFRFTQGSPEKENLFYESLEQVKDSRKTLVAWHGSRLENWHSIIREGLDYAVTANGRAHGNGIYFAREFDTSRSYTCTDAAHADISKLVWPQSRLQVESVVSLNELVNLPYDFVSHSPFYVVQHCHWTQCRYLFAKPTGGNFDLINASNSTARPNGTDEFQQDPKWIAKGPGNAQLFIPNHAIPTTHKAGKGSYEKEIKEWELISSDEDEDDTKFINPQGGITPTSLTLDTDFRPGTLDFTSLPQLAPPSYATNAAQRALGHEVKKLEKTQSSTPLHLLGWYIDFERLNNLFQWIVELHSFDSELPLAKDMKKAGLTSIVIEIRFLRGFPMSPPFVRIIRPRFLPFMNGGGGHVTSGGALCMELLTNSGWSPVNSLESVLLQVRMAICSEDPRPARLQSTGGDQGQYGVAEAIEAYKRAAATHGWEIPPDLADASKS